MRIGLLSAQSEEKILFYERLTHYCFFRHPHSISPLTVVLRRGDDVLMNRTDYTHTNSHSMLEQTDRACTQRWALVLSTIDRDVINVLTEFLFRIPVLHSFHHFHLSILLTIIHCYKSSVGEWIHKQ